MTSATPGALRGASAEPVLPEDSPLFFSSNALYPERFMPGWLQAISKVNPLSYEVNALRGLLIGLPTNLALDFGVLAGATTAAITVASLLLPRLAK